MAGFLCFLIMTYQRSCALHLSEKKSRAGRLSKIKWDVSVNEAPRTGPHRTQPGSSPFLMFFLFLSSSLPPFYCIYKCMNCHCVFNVEDKSCDEAAGSFHTPVCNWCVITTVWHFSFHISTFPSVAPHNVACVSCVLKLKIHWATFAATLEDLCFNC